MGHFCKELLIAYLTTIKYSTVLLFETGVFYSWCSMFLYIQSFKLHSLIAFILLRYWKLHVMVNIRTNSLFQRSRSWILIFLHYRIFIGLNIFKVVNSVIRNHILITIFWSTQGKSSRFSCCFFIDFRKYTKRRVPRLYTRALYRLPFSS